MGEKKFIFTEK